MDNYYTNQDVWWDCDENQSPNPHNNSYNNEPLTYNSYNALYNNFSNNNEYYEDECYNNEPYNESYENGGWSNDNSYEDQQYLSGCISSINEKFDQLIDVLKERFPSHVEQASEESSYNEKLEQVQDYDNSYDYYDQPQQYDSYSTEQCWGNNYDQINESPYFSENENPESSEESSFSQKLDQMMAMVNETNQKVEMQYERILARGIQIDEMCGQLNQQPPGNFPDSTQEDEVCFSCNNESFDINVYSSTPPDTEIMVEDYIQINDEDIEMEIINQENTEIETPQITLQELATPKVGEEILKVNTTPHPATLETFDTQPLVVMDNKKSNEIIDCPPLATIYAQNSCRESSIDTTFGKENLRPLGPTNDPPICGDLIVINTIDDYNNEHTANMLPTYKLENCFSCDRSKALDFSVGQNNVKRKSSNKKHDATRAKKSKMKAFKEVKNITPRKYARLFTTMFKRAREKFKNKKLGLYKVEENIPFDPGGRLLILRS